MDQESDKDEGDRENRRWGRAVGHVDDVRVRLRTSLALGGLSGNRLATQPAGAIHADEIEGVGANKLADGLEVDSRRVRREDLDGETDLGRDVSRRRLNGLQDMEDVVAGSSRGQEASCVNVTVESDLVDAARIEEALAYIGRQRLGRTSRGRISVRVSVWSARGVDTGGGKTTNVAGVVRRGADAPAMLERSTSSSELLRAPEAIAVGVEAAALALNERTPVNHGVNRRQSGGSAAVHADLVLRAVVHLARLDTRDGSGRANTELASASGLAVVGDDLVLSAQNGGLTTVAIVATSTAAEPAETTVDTVGRWRSLRALVDPFRARTANDITGLRRGIRVDGTCTLA